MTGIFSSWRCLIPCNQVTLGLLFDKLNKSCPSNFSLEAVPPPQPLNHFGGSFLILSNFSVSSKTVRIPELCTVFLHFPTMVYGETQLQPHSSAKGTHMLSCYNCRGARRSTLFPHRLARL